MSSIKINRKNHDAARKYFGILGNVNYDLHHKDTNLIYTDPVRYNEWRPEDLLVLTHSEHSKLHCSMKNENFGIPVRPVRCIETGDTYGSTQEVARAFGKKGIRDCLIGKSKTYCGYHWEYI